LAHIILHPLDTVMRRMMM